MNRLIDKNRYGSAQSTLDSPRGVPKILAAFVFLAAVLGVASPASAQSFINSEDSLKNPVLVTEFNTPNGVIDPGETNTVRFSFKLTGANLDNVKVKLVPSANITFVTPGEISLGNIAKDAVRTAEFTFVAFGDCGARFIPELTFRTGDNADASAGRLLYNNNGGIRLGKVTEFPHVFSNSGAITIKDNANADPFPSKIKVEGISFSDNALLDDNVERVEVTLNGLTHPFAQDVDIILVGPNGIGKAVLMSDAGGHTTSDSAVNDVTLTFRANASNFIPLGSGIASGSYKPFDYSPTDIGFAGGSSPMDNADNQLRIFQNKKNVNGDWELYVRDDSAIDAGSILRGWSLNIITRKVVCSGGGFPTITKIDNVEANEDPGTADNVAPKTINFTINDAEEAGDLSKLTVTVTSDRPDMFPKGMTVPDPDDHDKRVGTLRVFSNGGGSRFIRLYPAQNVNGNALITVTVTDPQGNASSVQFEFKVNARNDNPSISEIPNTASNENTPTAEIPFTVSDVDNSVDSLAVGVTASSNPSLVPISGVIVSGSGANRTVRVFPNTSYTGSVKESTITLTVVDPNSGSSTRDFKVAFDVKSGDVVVAPINNVTIDEDKTATVKFGISDSVVPVEQLVIIPTSGNTTTLPNANISVSGVGTGVGATRIITLTMTPTANYHGTVPVTVLVKRPGTADNTGTSRQFNLVINPVNDKPYFVFGSTTVTLNEDSASAVIPFGVYDAEQNISGPDLVLVDYTGNNSGPGVPSFATPGLIAKVEFSGSGNFNATSRGLKITPVANAFGKTKMTLRMTDAGGTEGTIELDVVVNGINDVPTIDMPAANPSIAEDTAKDSALVNLGGITAGPGEFEQTLTITAVSGDTSKVSGVEVVYNQNHKTAADHIGTATLKLTLVKHAVGNDVPITVTVKDNGGSGNGGVDTVTKSFKVNITPVNDSPVLKSTPSVDEIPDLLVFKNETRQIAFYISDLEDTDATKLTVSAAATPALPNNPLIERFEITAGGNVRSLSIVPKQDVSGGPTVITLTVTDTQGASASQTINYSVSTSAANKNPSVDSLLVSPGGAAIPDPLVMDEDTIRDITVMVSDADGANDSATLKLAAFSSDQNIIPNSNLLPSGSGAQRTLTIVPLPDSNGDVKITVRVTDSDGVNPLSGEKTFNLHINGIPDVPKLSDLPSGEQSVDEDKVYTTDITISDAETPADQLTFETDSSNGDILPKGNADGKSGGIKVTGSGNSRKLELTPAANQNGGPVTVTLRVVDQTGLKVAKTMQLRVNSINDVPRINTIADRTVAEDSGQTTVALSGLRGGPDAPNEPRDITFGGPDHPGRAITDNATLIPESNTSFTDYVAADGTANLRFTPAANKNGTAKLGVIVMDTAGLTTTNYVTVTVTPVNDAPYFYTDINNPSGSKVTSLPNPASVPEGSTVFTAPFNVGDVESRVADLITEFVSSSNPSLVDASSVAFSGGQGVTRSVVITPKGGSSGTAVVTIQVRDTGDGSSAPVATQASFTVTVTAVNSGPVISAIPDQVTIQGIDSDIIPFTITDRETPAADLAGSLVVTVTASNPAGLVPASNIFLDKSTPPDYRMILRPAAGLSGQATIMVSATDGNTNTTSRTFKLTVRTPQNPPTITAIANQTIQMNQTATASFTISDPETPAGFLKVTGTSSAQSLVPDSAITFNGSSASRTVQITPLANKSGQALITIKVTDPDTNSVTTTFTLTVTGSGEPTISTISSKTTSEDTAITVPFTVSDLETTDASQLLVTAVSGDAKVVPATGIVISTTGSNRTVTITPAKDQNGANIPITLTVTDADGKSAVTTFALTVTPVDDSPTISAIANQTTTTGKTVGPIAFTVSDPETTANLLTVVAQSSNTQLVPANGVVLGGSEGNRTLTITPAANVASGTAIINVTVRDSGNLSTTTSFTLTVGASTAKNNSMNADTKADLLFQHTDGTLAVWLMDDVDLVSAQLLDPSAVAPGWNIAATGDMDKDGKMDVIFQHNDGTLAVWYMNSINMQSAELLNPNNSGSLWKVVAAADVNNNGQLDLVFQHTDGTVAAWLMNGSSLVSASFANPSTPGDAGWRIVGMGDLNKDSKSDLLFQHQVTGELATWYMDGLNLTGAAMLNPTNPGAGWKVKVIADYTGDGNADLIFQNGGDLAIWYMNGINLLSGEYLPAQTGSAAWSVVGPK